MAVGDSHSLIVPYQDQSKDNLKASFGHRSFKIASEREIKAKGTILLLRLTLILNVILNAGFLVVYLSLPAKVRKDGEFDDKSWQGFGFKNA